MFGGVKNEFSLGKELCVLVLRYTSFGDLDAGNDFKKVVLFEFWDITIKKLNMQGIKVVEYMRNIRQCKAKPTSKTCSSQID